MCVPIPTKKTTRQGPRTFFLFFSPKSDSFSAPDSDKKYKPQTHVLIIIIIIPAGMKNFFLHPISPLFAVSRHRQT